MLEMKIRRNQLREQQLHAIQMKASTEREQRRQKISETKKFVYDNRRASYEQRKEESRHLHEIVYTGKVMTETEKRRKAEQEKIR
jgi:hypothetical protein